MIFRDIIGHSAADNWGWLGSQLADKSRIVLAASSEPQRFPAGALKILVQPGDNPINSSGERNELLWTLNKDGNDENGDSGTLYYGISIFLPSGWRDTAQWCVPIQLHGPGNLPAKAAPPAFALDLSRIPGHYCLSQNGGDVNGVIARTQTDLGLHLINTWVDFIFQVKWAMDGSAYTASWTRSNPFSPPLQQEVGTGKPIAPHTKPTLYGANGAALPHYWKRGCYRNAEQFTTMFYASPLSRAKTLEEAAAAAFCQ